MREVYIVSAARTAIGSFGGTLAGIPATQLGAHAIKGALDKINLDVNSIDELFMGCVNQANLGQAPARQAGKLAGLPDKVNCTTINKVCSSGMKSITLGAQTILAGDNDIVIAGGMENMSQIPFYLDNYRWGAKYGHGQVIDGLAKDGLTDAFDHNAMGVCGDLCAREYKVSREEQDAYAIESYKRSAAAWAAGKFKDEVVPVKVKTKKGEFDFIEDEEYKNVNFEKIPTLKPVFGKDGTVTAANASTMNDGASALILMSKEKATELGIKPIARIVSYADAELEPKWFTITPSVVIPKALKKAGLQISDIDYFEFNEAFSVVGIVNPRILNIDSKKVNIHGGAVSLGHPLGSSGARIVVTLINILQQNNARYGAAALCNGGGGSTGIVIERM